MRLCKSNNSLSFLFDQKLLEINGMDVDCTRVLGYTNSFKRHIYRPLQILLENLLYVSRWNIG